MVARRLVRRLGHLPSVELRLRDRHQLLSDNGVQDSVLLSTPTWVLMVVRVRVARTSVSEVLRVARTASVHRLQRPLHPRHPCKWSLLLWSLRRGAMKGRLVDRTPALSRGRISSNRLAKLKHVMAADRAAVRRRAIVVAGTPAANADLTTSRHAVHHLLAWMIETCEVHRVTTANAETSVMHPLVSGADTRGQMTVAGHPICPALSLVRLSLEDLDLVTVTASPLVGRSRMMAGVVVEAAEGKKSRVVVDVKMRGEMAEGARHGMMVRKMVGSAGTKSHLLARIRGEGLEGSTSPVDQAHGEDQCM